MIEDMTEDDRGKKCNCVCPSCGGHFIAKLKDDVKRKHFAHDGDACDEVKAYLDGLYCLLQEYLREQNCFTLPALGMGFPLEGDVTDETISFLEVYDINCPNHIEVTKELPLKFDQADIVRDSKEYPEAIIATRKKQKLAILIKPPNSACKIFHPKKYKDYSTLYIEFSDVDRINSSQKSEMFAAIQNQEFPIYWIYNKSWVNKKDKIEEKRNAHQRARVLNDSKPLQQSSQIQSYSAQRPLTNKNSRPPCPTHREPTILEKLNNPDEEAYDRDGERWQTCEECGFKGRSKLNFIEEYTSKKGINYGLCRECAEKLNKQE